jgi:6-phosphogluconolactonase/glucosamine-6-phosphate isomerase/deaminase
VVAFLVGGEEKRDILARVLAGDESLPAARVRAPETVVLADEAAAPRPAGGGGFPSFTEA